MSKYIVSYRINEMLLDLGFLKEQIEEGVRFDIALYKLWERIKSLEKEKK